MKRIYNQMNRPGEDTLIRYFRGQCTPEEADAVRLYLTMNIDGDYIKKCLAEAWGDLEEASGIAISKAQLEESWQKLEHLRTVEQEHFRAAGTATDKGTARPARRAVHRKMFLRYAAALVLLLTGALTYQLFSSTEKKPREAVISYQTFSAPKGQAKRVKLTDGSLVTLFPGSSIQIAGNFNQQERTVLLLGRAFFEVAQDARRPFYVRTEQLTTRVLGTAFDVNAGSKITLLNGRVSVSYAMEDIATLDPGQQVVFDSLTHQWQISHVNAKDVMAWTSGEFIYERASLQQVFHDIENWYDVNIQISQSSIRDREITTNFKGLPLEQVLTMIAKASGLRYTISGKQVLVSEAIH
jgi:transmembrane sensor